VKKLHTLLGKFTSITPPDPAVRIATVAAVKQITGVTLALSSVEVRKGIIYIKTKALVKSEILLHKKEILEVVRGEIVSEKEAGDIH